MPTPVNASAADEIRDIIGGFRQQVSRLAELTELAGRTNDVPALIEIAGLLRWLPSLKWDLTHDRCVALTHAGQRCPLPSMRLILGSVHCRAHRVEVIRSLPWIPRPSGRGGNEDPAEQDRESRFAAKANRRPALTQKLVECEKWRGRS
jgi:hypothetical protein